MSRSEYGVQQELCKMFFGMGNSSNGLARDRVASCCWLALARDHSGLSL